MFQIIRKQTTALSLPKSACRLLSRKLSVAFIAASLTATALPAFAGKYDTKTWGGKFRYGAYSTLISSHVMGTQFKDLIILLSQPLPENEEERENKLKEIKAEIQKFNEVYKNLQDDDIDKIIEFASTDQTPSIYEEEQSVVSSINQNNVFKQGMIDRRDLKPVDNLIENDKFRKDNFQFNTHRALYNNAYGIPQNSLAGIANAYVSGIRSVEFDVLNTSDGVNIVIHDLVSNSLDGSYNDPPKFVEQLPFSEVQNTNIDVINPLVSQPAVENTDVKHIMPTEQVLEVVCKLMPEMTLYADARNDAPVTLIRMLGMDKYKNCRNNIVIKIYPFILNGGLTDLVERYAKLYYSGDQNAALQEITTINPHVLLVVGNAESESNQDVLLTGVTGFTWEKFQEEARHFPFSRTAEQSRNQFNGQRIFSDQELMDIEIQTFKLFRWTMGFAGNMNVLIFQESAIPSLVNILDNQNTPEYGKLGAMKIKAAAHDNFAVLYRKVMAGNLNLQVANLSLKDRIQNARFGLSDRYQDFTIAEREIGDVVKADTMKSFVYSMMGTAAESNGYAALKMRSTKAMVERVNEIEASTGTKTVYATTDLPVDLRLAFMGALGTEGLPVDVTYRPSSVIKENCNCDPVNFQLPTWTTRTYGAAYNKHLQSFDKDYKEIQGYRNDRKKKIEALHALQQTMEHNVPVLHKDVFAYLNPLTRDQIGEQQYKIIVDKLNQEIQELNLSIEGKVNDFQTKYQVPFAAN